MKKKEVVVEEWTITKSGAKAHSSGHWWACAYVDGWFFYNRTFLDNLGPYKTFEAGLKDWDKVRKTYKNLCLKCAKEISKGAYCPTCQKERDKRY